MKCKIKNILLTTIVVGLFCAAIGIGYTNITADAEVSETQEKTKKAK